MDLCVTEQCSLTDVGTLFGQLSLLRNNARSQQGGAMWPVGRWMVLPVDRMSDNPIRSHSDITALFDSDDDSSNNQDQRDEHLERKRRTFHDDGDGDDDDDEESAWSSLLLVFLELVRDRLVMFVLYSKRFVLDSTRRKRMLETKSVGSRSKGTSVYLFSFSGFV